jgi:hypothetical protein
VGGDEDEVGAPVDHAYFLNPKSGQRAQLFSCELTFDHYETIDAFLNLSPTSNFPLFLLGQTEDKVMAEIKRHSDGSIWELPAIDTSIGNIRISADTDKGKVVRITAELPDIAVLPTLRARLEKLFGKPTTAATEPKLRWIGPTAITISTTSNRIARRATQVTVQCMGHRSTCGGMKPLPCGNHRT